MSGRKSQSGGDDNGNAVAASAWKLLKISLSHGDCFLKCPGKLFCKKKGTAK